MTAAPALAAKEICRICGVTQRTLRRWVSTGSPRQVPRVRRGGRYYYDPDEFAGWLRAAEKHEEFARLNGYLASTRGEPAKEPRAEVAETIEQYEETQRRERKRADEKELARELGVSGKRKAAAPTLPTNGDLPAQTDSDWDIFAIRDTTARMYTEAVKMFTTALPGEKIAHQKNANAAADLMRKLELDCIAVAKEMRLVMLMADLEKLFGAMCSRVKHDLMNLPHAVADDLAALNSADEIAQCLEERITDALRHLSDGLRNMECDEQ